MSTNVKDNTVVAKKVFWFNVDYYGKLYAQALLTISLSGLVFYIFEVILHIEFRGDENEPLIGRSGNNVGEKRSKTPNTVTLTSSTILGMRNIYEVS